MADKTNYQKNSSNIETIDLNISMSDETIDLKL